MYLADCLQKKQPDFFQRFERELNDCRIDFQFLPNTKDIWAVDFMPVQISKDKFVQFLYKADYLKGYKHTISDVDSIIKEINLTVKKSNLIVDGGNVVRTTDKVIMCDKVFNENKHIPERELIRQLIELFEVDQLIFVPWDKNDIIGHADGMVRFINDDTVLINDYSLEDKRFQRNFRLALHNARLNYIELPYNPLLDKKSISATGIYINYLQMEQAILLPIFESEFDDTAFKIINESFSKLKIKTIESNDLAEEGGILNCISWNILE